MTNLKQNKAAKEFYIIWEDKGYEKGNLKNIGLIYLKMY